MPGRKSNQAGVKLCLIAREERGKSRGGGGRSCRGQAGGGEGGKKLQAAVTDSGPNPGSGPKSELQQLPASSPHPPHNFICEFKTRGFLLHAENFILDLSKYLLATTLTILYYSGVTVKKSESLLPTQVIKVDTKLLDFALSVQQQTLT